VRWDRFFDDLEDQLASEWEAERAALDTEAERLRLSRVSLRERLAALVDAGGRGPVVTADVVGGATLSARVTALGADWVAFAPVDSRVGAVLTPLACLVSVGMPHADLLRSARPVESRTSLSDRMTLGFVLRDLVRRRTPVVAQLTAGRSLHGTIDRAGVDHFDLALHEPGSPRRADAVTGYRVVPFTALAWVRLEGPLEVA
jgi:hypothetical protein